MSESNRRPTVYKSIFDCARRKHNHAPNWHDHVSKSHFQGFGESALNAHRNELSMLHCVARTELARRWMPIIVCDHAEWYVSFNVTACGITQPSDGFPRPIHASAGPPTALDGFPCPTSCELELPAQSHDHRSRRPGASQPATVHVNTHCTAGGHVSSDPPATACAAFNRLRHSPLRLRATFSNSPEVRPQAIHFSPRPLATFRACDFGTNGIPCTRFFRETVTRR